ncbi:hypothetical protein ACFZBP_07785 [Streptomyces sp. NPDC008086]|uniref:hypothetical protein n=1 Tax=Streptomyces sp. NPDC008086 TaxID=3364807 RepID=UPI0036E1C554
MNLLATTLATDIDISMARSALRGQEFKSGWRSRNTRHVPKLFLTSRIQILIRADGAFLLNVSGHRAMTSVDELCAVAIVINAWDDGERAETSLSR